MPPAGFISIRRGEMKSNVVRLGAAAVLALGLVSASSGAFADETTTTTTTHRDGGAGVTVGVPGVVGVQIGKPDSGCTTHKSTTTDEDTGTKVTRKSTNC